jgi:hypothetical protein
MNEISQRLTYEVANVGKTCVFLREKMGVYVDEFIRAYLLAADSEGTDYFCVEATVLGELVGYAIPIKVAEKNDLFTRVKFTKVLG